MKLDPFDEIISDVASGRPIVLIDDKTRENEGDITIAAERITPEIMNFMLQHGKGLVCLSITEERRQALGVPLQVQENSSPFGTNFAVSFDHHSVRDAGITAQGRTTTVLAAIDDASKPSDFVLPGYIFPVCAVSGGVLRRRGQTEGSVDLARIAGLKPAGVICEIMGPGGEMLRGAALEKYCREHQLKITSVEEIVQYRLLHEVSLRRVGEFELTADMGFSRNAKLGKLLQSEGTSLRVLVYMDDVDEKEHLAFVCGSPENDCLVRIHSECLTGDIFSSRRCDCGSQFDQALEMILSEKSGVLVYLHQEGRGIGLANKLRAYELQDDGLDTVEANLHLGFAIDSRSYRAGAQILSDLGLEQVRLLTNNPEKVGSLNAHGIEVSKRIPIRTAEDEFNRSYLTAKKNRLGHIFE